MAYQILQIAGGGSRLMNMDNIVSLHIEVVESVATGDLEYFVCFTTSSLKADCRVKYETMEDALEYLKETTGIVQAPEVQVSRPVVTGFNTKRQ
ncbi:hypothetical protein [Hymenobacter coccineus]|uniref:Uncharacterized protein n=1 Tax=Hymenobacter coccineus TaxID=1908235 RepID=A0A1G1TH99_9BACT|nr:hypothetical protein [Hymenobacter coccineus]OGX90235.1 hypothetical protein BEN49_07240 [Hymenobacter coccineus]